MRTFKKISFFGALLWVLSSCAGVDGNMYTDYSRQSKPTLKNCGFDFNTNCKPK